MKLLTILVAMLFLMGSPVFADELIFKNGDHLTGRLTNLIDGKITFDAKTVGTVTVNISDIETIATDDPVEVHLTNGETIKMKLMSVKGGFFSLDSPDMRIFSDKDVVSINPPPPVGPMPDTTGTVNANSTFEPGKVEKTSTDVNFDMKHQTRAGTISAQTGVLYAEQKDRASLLKSTTQDSFYAVGKYDFCLDKRPFGYLSTKFETDRIAKLDKRLTTGVGMDYCVIDKSDLNFRVNSDALVLYEKFDGMNDKSDINAQLGYNVQKRFGRNWVLSHGLKYVPESRDLSNLLLTTNAELKANLTRFLLWNFSVTMNYDSTPSDNTDGKDLKYMMGVQWNVF